MVCSAFAATLFVDLVKTCICNNISYCLLIFVDHTALLWSIETGKCLVKYVGHVGSGKIRAYCESWKQCGRGKCVLHSYKNVY